MARSVGDTLAPRVMLTLSHRAGAKTVECGGWGCTGLPAAP